MLTIYSKKNCPQCVHAKNFLQSRNVSFNEVKIDEDPSAREFVIAEGHRTVPQFYLNGKLFVEQGFQGLAKLSDSDLLELLEA
ncbi:GrxC Glutaredoxin and related proteins [uncultured Caudovirales phage]|uniref:GrxC Glutaredoxin and related proteins n=1 Tax=uncultured Caudovirales phage TaxID=2100421 RepID=A0A6J5L5S6_9CAUD|nr:GrxC Glutaredoxin and related proteins [uncultured Caudovirales phage]